MRFSLTRRTCLGKKAAALTLEAEECARHALQWQIKFREEGPEATNPVAPHEQLPRNSTLGCTKSDDETADDGEEGDDDVDDDDEGSEEETDSLSFLEGIVSLGRSHTVLLCLTKPLEEKLRLNTAQTLMRHRSRQKI